MSKTPRSISVRIVLVGVAQVPGVGGQQLVREVVGLAHGLRRLGRALDRHGLRELRLPERHGVHERRVDLGDEALVVLLHQPDRGQRLHRDLPRQLEVMDPALQIVAGRAQVAQLLRLHHALVLGRGLHLGLLGGDVGLVEKLDLASPAAM
jgi:hypothetical protein